VLAAVLVIMSGTMVSGIGCLAYDILIVTHGPDPMYMLQELRYVVVAVTSTVVYNWTVTGLIVARLWWASKRMIENNLFSHYDGVETKPVAQTYQKLIFILVESGAVYSAVWIVWIVAYVKSEVSLRLWSWPSVLTVNTVGMARLGTWGSSSYRSRHAWSRSFRRSLFW